MKKRGFEAEIIKQGFSLLLKIKVAPEIEEYFKAAAKRKNSSDFTEKSEKWLDEAGNGLTFYIKDETLGTKIPSYSIFDNFGSSLMDDRSRINLALLRTVGASNGLTIRTNDLLPLEELKVYVNKLADWTRDFYEIELRDCLISSVVSLEMINQ